VSARRIGAACLLALLAYPLPAAAQELLVDIFGVSYHYRIGTFFDDAGRERRHNAVNVGAGARYSFTHRGRNIVDVVGGVYRDSEYRAAKYAGLSYKLKLWANTQSHFAIGIDAGRIWTPTYPEDWVALPTLSVRHKKVALILTWLPDQEAPALALSASIALR
jgi:hypothetical protein